jgi:hypothetical protein
MGPRAWSGTLATVAAIFAFAPALAAQSNPQKLVQEMVYNELHADKSPTYWMYRDANSEAGKATVKRVVQTRECWLSWEISENGHALSAEEQQQQQAKVDKLVNDPAARRRSRSQIDHDGKQAEDLMKILPDAFLYTADGEQDGNIRLKFRPNPKFHPPTNAAKVFHNMGGTLLVNKRETRLAGIDGTLLADVDFGWGILGKLTKGGTFKVMQSELAPQDWEVTMLDVHIHGHALFFHTISEDQHEAKSEFQLVPADIKLTQAAALAEHGTENVSASAR